MNSGESDTRTFTDVQQAERTNLVQFSSVSSIISMVSLSGVVRGRGGAFSSVSAVISMVSRSGVARGGAL